MLKWAAEGFMKFYTLATGAKFEFGGLQYEKIALGFAAGIGDGPKDHRYGSSFMGETEVMSEGPFLSAEEAAKHKPSERHWTEHLGRAYEGNTEKLK